MLQEVIACELGVEIGSYYHMVGSMHIYTPDFEKMKKILNTPVIHTPMEPMPKNTALGTFEMLSYFEKEYRENNIKVNIPPEESLKYGNYWNDKITWLYKKETYRERVKDE
jgi:thymidylate synthase